MPVIIAGVAIVGITIAWKAGLIGSKTSGTTLEQFKKELADISIEGEGEIVTKKALIDKMGEPEKVQVVATDVYIYYTIAGGMVQIISDQLAWEGGRQTKIRKAGSTPPRRPQTDDEFIALYKRNGGTIPVFSIKEENTGNLSANVVLLKDGQIVKRFPAKSSITTTACANPTVMHKLKAEVQLDTRKYPSEFVGCYVIQDGNGTLIEAMCYYGSGQPGTEEYDQFVAKTRKQAQAKADETAAGLRKNYAEGLSSYQYAVEDRKKDAQNYIRSEMSDIRNKGERQWDDFMEKWDNENSIVVKEPVLYIGKMNMY